MKFEKTITTMFIVPTLGIDREKLKLNEFINGYGKDEEREVQYENCIYLLFKPEDLDKFRLFLDEEYERTKELIDDYDYPNGYVVLVYNLDNKYKNDYDLIKKGKYSETSRRFKALFPKTVTANDDNGNYVTKITLQYRIFNKTEDLREFWEEKLQVELPEDSEVWTLYDEINETLNLNKIKENV
jgi:hypothetical protein